MGETQAAEPLQHAARYLHLYFHDLWSGAAPVVLARSVADIFNAQEDVASDRPTVLIGQYTRLISKVGRRKAEDILGQALLAVLSADKAFMQLVEAGDGHLHALFFQNEPHTQYKLLHYAAFATLSELPAHPEVVADIARGLLPPGGDGSALVGAVSSHRAAAA